MKPTSIQKNSFWNMLAQCCTIGYWMVTWLYVSRVIGADGLGRCSFSDTIVQYFVLLATLGIPTYAIREGARIREDRQAMGRLGAQLTTLGLIAAAAAYVLMFALVLAVPRLKREMVLIGILSLQIILTILGRDWLNTIYEDFFFFAVRNLAVELCAMILIFALVRRPEDLVTYVWIQLLATGGLHGASALHTLRHVPFSVTSQLDLKRHLRPVMLLLFGSIAMTIYINSDVTMLGFFRSDAEVGIYTLSSRIYTTVKALINTVIFVVVPRLSYALGQRDEESFQRLLKNLKTTLLALLLPAITGLWCVRRDVMLLLGGEAFAEGGTSLGILSLALLAAVFACYYAQGILVVRREEAVVLRATVYSAVLNVALNFIAIPHLGMNGAALTTLAAELLMMGYCGRKAGKSDSAGTVIKDDKGKRLFMRETGIVLLGCAVIFAMCYLMGHLVQDLVLRMACSVVLSVAGYVAVLFACGHSLVKK